MVVCAVATCKSNSNKKLKQNIESGVVLKFFKFPQKNDNLCKIWTHKCCRKDKFNVVNAYICSKHFKPDHYARNLRHELLNYSSKKSKKLKPDAVPTEDLPSSKDVTDIDRLERQRKRSAKQMIREILESASTSEIEVNDGSRSKYEQVDNDVCVRDDILVKFVDKATNTDTLNTLISERSSQLLKTQQENKRLLQECNKLRAENDYIKKIFITGQRSAA